MTVRALDESIVFGNENVVVILAMATSPAAGLESSAMRLAFSWVYVYAKPAAVAATVAERRSAEREATDKDMLEVRSTVQRFGISYHVSFIHI